MNRQEHREAPVDCRSHAGITTGLIDSIITAAHVLATRDLTPDPVQQALADLRHDPDVAAIIGHARLDVRALVDDLIASVCETCGCSETYHCAGKTETECLACIESKADPRCLEYRQRSAQPDLPSVMHEVHAAIDPDQVQKARLYYQTFPDGDLRRMRDYRLWEAAEAVAYLTVLTERLAASSDD